MQIPSEEEIGSLRWDRMKILKELDCGHHVYQYTWLFKRVCFLCRHINNGGTWSDNLRTLQYRYKTKRPKANRTIRVMVDEPTRAKKKGHKGKMSESL